MSKLSEQRSDQAAAVSQGPSWRWVWLGLALALVAWGIYYFVYYRRPASTLDGFARCLSAKNTKMYGAWWCPHCADEKELFGYAFHYVNYVECSPPGQHTENASCKQAGIKNFPTWQFSDGSRIEGTEPLAVLSQKTGCALR